MARVGPQLHEKQRNKQTNMFRALLAHRQETNDTWYIACVLCQLAVQGLVQPTDITRTQYTKCRLCNAS
jgi:hypothetical protein